MNKLFGIFEYYVDDNGCFICTSHVKDNNGYIVCWKKHKGKLYRRVHRYIYAVINNCILDSETVVRHKCDNPNCINPDHLEIGTHADNVMDRVKRNRSAIGSKHGRSKLTEEEVKIIKLDNITPHSVLARKFGVNEKVIANIRKGRIWKHVLPDVVNTYKPSKPKPPRIAKVFNEELVKEIKLMFKQGMTPTEVSRITGFNRRTLSDIKNNKRWKNVIV